MFGEICSAQKTQIRHTNLCACRLEIFNKLFAFKWSNLRTTITYVLAKFCIRCIREKVTPLDNVR